MLLRNVIERVKKEIGSLFLNPFYNTINRIQYNHISASEKNLVIKIKDIKAWYRGNRYNEVTFPGIIKGGNWNNRITSKKITLKNLAKYRSVIQRYSKGITWPETDLFKQRYASQIKKGERVKGCETLDELEKHYEKTYDRLFENLKENGIQPASDAHPHIEPIYIMIYRNGEILYTMDGNHRLFMCMVLGIEEIPVRVWMRHAEWQGKREYILSRKGKNIKPEYRKYLSHPDIVSELGD